MKVVDGERRGSRRIPWVLKEISLWVEGDMYDKLLVCC